MSNTDSSNSSKNQIFMRIFIFYHEIICCTTYRYYIEDCEDFSRLSPFASWPGLMFDAQWLEQPMSRTRLCFPKDVRAIEVCFTIFALKWESFNSSYNHTYPKMWACPLYYTYLFTCRRVASSSSVLVHPDQALHHVASDLGLHCLLSPMSPNTHRIYGKPYNVSAGHSLRMSRMVWVLFERIYTWWLFKYWWIDSCGKRLFWNILTSKNQ